MEVYDNWSTETFVQSFDLSLQRNAKNLKPVDSRANIAGLVKLSFAQWENKKDICFASIWKKLPDSDTKQALVALVMFRCSDHWCWTWFCKSSYMVSCSCVQYWCWLIKVQKARSKHFVSWNCMYRKNKYGTGEQLRSNGLQFLSLSGRTIAKSRHGIVQCKGSTCGQRCISKKGLFDCLLSWRTFCGKNKILGKSIPGYFV